MRLERGTGHQTPAYDDTSQSSSNHLCLREIVIGTRCDPHSHRKEGTPSARASQRAARPGSIKSLIIASLLRLVLDELDRVASVIADEREGFGRCVAHLEGHLHPFGLQFRENGGQVPDLEAEVLHSVRAEVF